MKKAWLLATVGALLFASYWLGRQEGAAEVAEIAAASAPQSAAAPGSATGADAAGAVPAALESAEPLPPVGTPLAQMYDVLKQRADGGEGRAACRLGIELVRCRMLRRRSMFLPAALDSAESAAVAVPGDARQRLQTQNDIDESRLRLLEAEQLCQGVAEEQFRESFRYLRQGAHAGHGEAVAAYADGAGFYPGDLSMLRSPQFDLWRREAAMLTERAFKRGSPEVVMIWTIAHDHDDSPFAALVPNDPVEAQAIRLLRQRLLGEPLTQSSTLATADYQTALARSETMFKEYFGGQVRERIEDASWMAADLTNPGEVAPLSHAPCE